MGLFDSYEVSRHDIFAHLDDPWSHDDEGGLPSTLSTGGLEYAPVDDVTGWLSAGYTIDEIAAAGWEIAMEESMDDELARDKMMEVEYELARG